MERLLSREKDQFSVRNVVREMQRRRRMHQIDGISKSLPVHAQTPDSKVRVETERGVMSVRVVKRGYSHTGEYLTTESTTQISRDTVGGITHIARTVEMQDDDYFSCGPPSTSEYDLSNADFDPSLLRGVAKDLRFARDQLAAHGLM